MQGRIDVKFRMKGDKQEGTVYFTSIRPTQGAPWRIGECERPIGRERQDESITGQHLRGSRVCGGVVCREEQREEQAAGSWNSLVHSQPRPG